MISNVPSAFSDELVGYHAVNHANVNLSDWVDSLNLTGDVNTDQQLWANYQANDAIQYAYAGPIATNDHHPTVVHHVLHSHDVATHHVYDHSHDLAVHTDTATVHSGHYTSTLKPKLALEDHIEVVHHPATSSPHITVTPATADPHPIVVNPHVDI
jgi:hypothetical protein